MRQAVIVSYARTGLAKAGRGGFNNTSNMTILGHAIRAAVERSKVDPAEIEDVIAGCVAAKPRRVFGRVDAHEPVSTGREVF